MPAGSALTLCPAAVALATDPHLPPHPSPRHGFPALRLPGEGTAAAKIPPACKAELSDVSHPSSEKDGKGREGKVWRGGESKSRKG